MSLLLLKGGPRHRLREAAGWLACGCVVLAVHGGALGYLLSKPPIAAADAPAAIMIELAEMPVSPEAEPTETAPGPPMVEAPKEVEEEVKPDPLAEVEDTPPPEPEPEIEQEPVPEVDESPAPDIEVPLPPPPPLAQELTPPEKPVEKPKERPKEKPKPRKKNKKPPAPRTAAAPALDAARSDRVAAPTQGASSSNSRAVANWRSRLMAHLNRHKRFPAGENGRGKSRVAFTIDRSGRVVAVRLVGSSGNPRFDQEAVAMIRRSSPVPAPPDDVGGRTISFTVPVDFTRR
ncbi:energy transducer TonB family protein [Ancylobacter mangrovi]|uniref:energy transducer TonB family protein n=1 Tax=Ancylobacter mangrovi TaxID=2972472 RepID=UPI002161F6D7|nr:TonB family protein [Ancylobacter mangrovi]MCS0501149.1 TonB family protein [Ancylobacter mangrovi]